MLLELTCESDFDILTREIQNTNDKKYDKLLEEYAGFKSIL